MFDILFDILKRVRNIQKKEISKQTNAFFTGLQITKSP